MTGPCVEEAGVGAAKIEVEPLDEERVIVVEDPEVVEVEEVVELEEVDELEEVEGVDVEVDVVL